MFKLISKIVVIIFLSILFFQINTTYAANECVWAYKINGLCSAQGLGYDVADNSCSNVSKPLGCAGGANFSCKCCCTTKSESSSASKTGINFKPQVEGLTYNFNNSDTTTGNIANYIKAIYQYGIGIVGILAAVVLMYGGVLWIVAGGNASQVGEAKAWIGAALTGLILALTSYMILNTINPALVNLQTTSVPGVTEMATGSCTTPADLDTGNVTCTDNVLKENCKYNFAKGETCPQACCLWGKFGTRDLWNGCFASKNLIESDCKRTGGSDALYIPNAANIACQIDKLNSSIYTGCTKK